MTGSQPASWYDAFYRRCLAAGANAYAKPAAASLYAPMWLQAIEWIAQDEGVCDLGCGVGQFAELAVAAGRRYVCGVDFSEVAIAEARVRNPAIAAAFHVRDIETGSVDDLPACDVFVLCEVLEHVVDDLGILARIPAGKHVIFSVPSFAWTSHVRKFAAAADAERRYGGLLDFGKRREYCRAGKYIWLWDARRQS